MTKAPQPVATGGHPVPLTASTATGRLLGALLDTPDLVTQLRALPPPAVTALVRRVGLEDAGEILALLSLEQLTELLDDVLWTGAPGADESFDRRRFATWLEVMLEAGETFAADRLADLSEDLLALAVSRMALVLELAEVEVSASDRDDGELVEKAMDSCLHEEIGEYFLVARHHDGWDALVSALLALDARHGALLERILARCWRAAHELLEDAGDLYTLLTDEDLLAVDAAAEREDRRAALGYVSPAAARAFLGLAARGRAGLEAGAEDAVTRAYFRELDVHVARHRYPAPPVVPASHLGQLLEPASVEPLAAAAAPVADGLRAELAALAGEAPERHGRALDELAFLANVVVAGDATRGRPWRPAEAAEEVLTVCERGLAALAKADGIDVASALARWGLPAAFRAGYAPPAAPRPEKQRRSRSR